MSKDVEVIVNGDPTEGSEMTIDNGNLELVVRVTSQAKSLCPVDTGSLRRSIMWKVPERSGGLEEGEPVTEEVKKGSGLVGTATDYAGYVEFGTRRQPAQPYLRPAVEIEILGPNGANILTETAIQEMAKALTKNRKVFTA